MIRVHRGAFDVATVSSKQPGQVMEEVVKVLAD